MVANGLGLAIR